MDQWGAVRSYFEFPIFIQVPFPRSRAAKCWGNRAGAVRVRSGWGWIQKWGDLHCMDWFKGKCLQDFFTRKPLKYVMGKYNDGFRRRFSP